ncbi:MAG TPA: hypothetical protein VHG31_02225 [Stellaceae bacterium]|nr:hypothetical protein [Stellaceae bacterium]
MKLPRILQKEYRGPVVVTAILTLFAWNAISFGWFGLPGLGFATAGGVEQVAVERMEAVAIPLAAELCAIKFNAQDPATVAAKSEKLQAATYTYARVQELDKSWVTLGKSRNSNQQVVDACVDLILATPPLKSADASK